MLEAELKASLAGMSTDELLGRACSLGFRPVRRLRETDVYFNGNDRDFCRTDEALRLRRVRKLPGGPEVCLLTYKGPKLDRVSSTRIEYETAVTDGETAGKLLEALGYRPVFTVEKLRREYGMENVTLCLDEVAGLGAYLELETLATSEAERGDAVETLLELLDRLEISRGRLTRESYLELLKAGGVEEAASLPPMQPRRGHS